MPLIYLDTSHIGLLARARTGNLAAYAKFAKAFRELGCTLAISRTHIIEIRQHADSAIRLERYALLASLTPVDTDVSPPASLQAEPLSLDEREALLALLARGAVSDSVPGRETLVAFPFHHSSSSDLSYFTTFESPHFGAIVEDVRSLMKAETALRARPSGSHYDPPRISDISDHPVPPERVAEALRLFENGLADDQFLHEVCPDMSVADAKAAVAPYAEHIRGMIRRSETVGPRRACFELLGVEPTGRRDRRRLDRVTQGYLHQQTLQDVSARFGLSTPDGIAAAINATPRAACPGSWLAGEVELVIRNAEESPQVSNAYDLEHIKYLPYVDVFFTDKRIANYLMRVRSQGECANVVQRLPVVAASANTVEALELTLRQQLS